MEILKVWNIDLEEVADCLASDVRLSSAPPSKRDLAAWHVTNLLDSAVSISKGLDQYCQYEGHPNGLMSFGRIWESAIDVYLSSFAGMAKGAYIPNVEAKSDEIVASLDGVLFLPEQFRQPIVTECKLKFSREDNSVKFRDEQQMKSYCYMSGTDLAMYITGHIGSSPPTVTASMKLLRFTPESVKENWDMLVSTKQYLAGRGIFPGSPAVPAVEPALIDK